MPRSRLRSTAPQSDTGNEGVVRIEFDNRWEGPGDVFQLVVQRLADCPIRVVPADGSPEFDAILLGGYPDYRPRLTTGTTPHWYRFSESTTTSSPSAQPKSFA